MEDPYTSEHPARTPGRIVVPVILAGGSGTRLWPLSRRQKPKQFLALGGQRRSLFQQTVLRSAAIARVAPPMIVGSASHRFLIDEQLAEIDHEPDCIVLEPAGRDTAPAVAIAAQQVANRYGPDAMALVMPADHAIDNTEAFVAAVNAAADVAEAGELVTFGIQPTRPETGYGYVRCLPANGRAVRTVDAFVEKPDAEIAQTYVADQDTFWNAGMFLFRADRMLEDLEALEPDLMQNARHALIGAEVDGRMLCLDTLAFRGCRSISIDYAVLERTDRIALMPMDAGWDDVGSWTYLDRLPAADDAGNRTQGDVLLQNAQDNIVHSSKRLVALSGVSDLIVVETADAILVAHKQDAQSVKTLVKQLESLGREEAEHLQRVYRPWGFYESIAYGSRFQTKRISVKPGAKLSLQMHHHRAEHWVIVQGTAVVERGGERFMLSENESTFIPIGTTHRLENPGNIPLDLIEVQSGAYLGEDDIVRFDDVYGRSETSEPEAAASGPASSVQTPAAATV